MMATLRFSGSGTPVVGGDGRLGLADVVDLDQVGGQAGGDQGVGDGAGALDGEAAVGGGAADAVGVADTRTRGERHVGEGHRGGGGVGGPPGVSWALAKSKWTSTVRRGRRGSGREAGRRLGGLEDRLEVAGVGADGLDAGGARVRRVGLEARAISASKLRALAQRRRAACGAGDLGLAGRERGLEIVERSSSRWARLAWSDARTRVAHREAWCAARCSRPRARRARRSGGRAPPRRRGRWRLGRRAVAGGGEPGGGRARRRRRRGSSVPEGLRSRRDDSGDQQRRAAANITPLPLHACSCSSSARFCCGKYSSANDLFRQRFLAPA